MATFMYSAKPLFVSGSLLAIRFLNIKFDVNSKNLFGINSFPKNFHIYEIHVLNTSVKNWSSQ